MKKIFILFISIGLLTSCEKVFFTPEPENTPTEVFNQFWESFNELYGPFQDRGIDWNAIYNQYAPLVHDDMSDDELFNVLAGMITPLNDGHVSLTAPGKKNYSSNKVYRDSIGFNLFDLDVIKNQYLGGSFEGDEDFGFVYGIINGDITYVFFPYVSDNLPIMDDVLNLNPSTKGIIIDLRHSFGGDFSWGLEYFGRFTDQSRLAFQSSTKEGPGPDDFGAWYDYYIEPTGTYFDKKVVFLTDRYTISASERSVMALKVLPNSLQIGDTTNGSHATMIGRELQNSWYYTLATQKVLFANGQSYEGIGMIPDILIKNTRTNLDNGIDDVLNKAIEQF